MGSSPKTTTGSQAPWEPTQPYLEQSMADTQALYQSGQGFAPTPFSTTTPYADQTMQAMQGTENLANQGNPLGDAAAQNALGVIQQGGTSAAGQQALQGGYDVATGARSIGGEQDYRDLMAQAQGYLGDTASGANIQGGSPEFNAALDRQSGRLADDVNRGYSLKGRYGSDSHTDAVGDAVGNFRNQALSSEIQREQAMQMQAANSLYGQQAGALGAIGNIQGTNIQNTVNAGQGYNTAMNQGQQIAGQYTGQVPSIYSQQYAPYQQLAAVGGQYEDLATRQMQENVDRFNQQQQEPWTRLANYNALIGGSGQLGNQTSSTVPGPSAFQNILGMAGTAAKFLPGSWTGG